MRLRERYSKCLPLSIRKLGLLESDTTSPSSSTKYGVSVISCFSCERPRATVSVCLVILAKRLSSGPEVQLVQLRPTRTFRFKACSFQTSIEESVGAIYNRPVIYEQFTDTPEGVLVDSMTPFFGRIKHPRNTQVMELYCSLDQDTLVLSWVFFL